jgi:hypothetical protein
MKKLGFLHMHTETETDISSACFWFNPLKPKLV